MKFRIDRLFFKPNVFKGISAKIAASCALALPMVLVPQSLRAAENLKFNYGLLGFSLAVESLELYAEKGEINSELNFYTKRLDDRTVKQLRRILQRRIKIDPILLYRLTRSPMIVDLIESLGEVATTHRDHNGFHAIRGSVVSTAIANQERGVTLIDVLKAFPGEDIWLDTAKLFELRDELTALVEYREAVRELVLEQAKQETAVGIANSFLPQKDLRTSGGISFTQQTIKINSRLADRSSGVRSREPFRIRLYVPQGLDKPAPVALLSHGFGSEPKSFDYLGEHLASHGIAAVSIEHLGSDSDYELEILAGAKKRCRCIKRRAIAPQEFVERPLDIHYVLDELEQRNQTDLTLKGKLDLEKVGAIGHSLGGYTALAVAGADINVDRLRKQCPNKKINLNISLLMQCQAKDLTLGQQLADPRIDAAIAISPISSGILGEENLKNISIPTAIMSGSEDVIAPVVQEQIYPFTWLSAKDKYLAMMIPGDHFSSSEPPRKKSKDPTIIEEFVLTLKGTPSDKDTATHIGKRLANGQPYIKAFAVAFIKAHVEQDSEYLPYLTASYAQNISSDEIGFSVIQSLNIQPLEREYSDILPVILPTLEK